MTIDEFIEKVRKGGFEITTSFYEPNVGGDTHINIEKLFLTPDAWKSCGKVEGWKDYMGELTLTGLDGEEIKPKSISEDEYNMHQMIDALAEGKTLEEFIETL